MIWQDQLPLAKRLGDAFLPLWLKNYFKWMLSKRDSFRRFYEINEWSFKQKKDHSFAALGFFSALSAFLGLSAFLVSFFSSSTLLALLSSSLSFLRRFMVTLAVVATLVANSKAPPAKVVLHPLHFQMPAAALRTWDYITNCLPCHKQGRRI